MRLPGPDYPAPAKLNLFLHVVGRRADGYHLLQSAFALIDRADRLRFAVRTDGRIARVNDVPGIASDDDLAVRAARLLAQASGTGLGVDVEVEKQIPVGGGLGGGSSDAATALLVLNRLWKTGLDDAALATLGLELGADVPFFLFGRNAWVEGIGERLAPLEIPRRWYVVLAPPVQVSTATVFAAPELTRDTEALKMEDFSARPESRELHNDLERVVCARYPQVREHLEWLRRRGMARMTGSGSCVFAPYASLEGAQRVLDELPPTMSGFIARGLERHPLRAQ
jgi:4-diphosphocytidyl-2-C-methyl-D-erythritol kinase